MSTETALETTQAQETTSNPAPTPTPVQNATTSTETTPTPPPSTNIKDWIDDKGQFKAGWHKAYGLPDSFTKFTQPEAVLKSHATLERAWGNPNKVAVPGPNSTNEERAAFQKAIGVPEKPEDYKFEKPAKIGDKVVPDTLWDKELIADFAKRAKDIGLTKAQADELIAYNLQQNLNAMDRVGQNLQAEISKSKAALKAEFGSEYDAKLASAVRAAKLFGGDELINHPALGNDPILIKALAKIGEATGERQGVGLRQPAGDTGPANPKEEARRIQANLSDPYHNAKHPDHQNRVQYVKSLYEAAQPKP